MRICVVYDCLYPYTKGGAERWYRGLAEGLAAKGHQVTYLTLRQWERNAPPAGEPFEVVGIGRKMSLYVDRKKQARDRRGLGSKGRRRILPPLVFGVGVFWHLLRHGPRYEVVHVCSMPYTALPVASLLRRRSGYRLAVDWFEVWSDAYWREYLGGVGGRVGAGVQRLCARAHQQAFCYSNLHARRLREEGLRGEVTVLRGLYADTVEPATVGPADRLVLFAGRMIPEKQAPLAVAAIASATRLIEGLQGELLGDGPERDTVLEAIAHHGLEEVVSAPGFTASETVDAEMRRAMCLLLPSIREGYGLVVVEAAARGTPSIVVAGPDNAAVELIEEGVNGFVCESSDPQEIAETIGRVHEAGPGLRESTARWFALHERELSLESSLQTVLTSYGRDGDSARV